MITTTLTGKQRYRVETVGWFCTRQLLILEVEVHETGSRTGYYYPYDTRAVNNFYFRDARIEDITVTKEGKP